MRPSLDRYFQRVTKTETIGSEDLKRVLNLPKRDPDKIPQIPREFMQREIEDLLRRTDTHDCICAKAHRPCITKLKPVQAWTLYELRQQRGILGAIGVGGGKTGLGILAAMVVPGVQKAALLLPPKLVNQFVRDYKLWAQHWRVPSITWGKSDAIIQKDPDAPALHLVPYSRLSQKNASVLLDSLKPDLIIADEAHMLRNANTARTGRFLRFFANSHDAMFACWSGSLTDKSIMDYAHLSALALGEGSPLPIDLTVAQEWSRCIDPPPPGMDRVEPGQLALLKESQGEDIRDAYNRRLKLTPGVIATEKSDIDVSLYAHERKAPPIPHNIQDALRELRATWTRPDGEELVEATAFVRCARELACGFYYRWIFPRGESESLIAEWFRARKAWNSEVRDKLQSREEHLDQPFLLFVAAARYHGLVEGKGPVWKSLHFKDWAKVKDLVKPQSQAVWLSDYLAQDAASWGLKNNGVIWYQHRAFGLKVAQLSGLPLHTGGPDAEEKIAAEKGDRSIIASIKSHGTGRDGLQYLFNQQLVANPPISRQTGGSAIWEQLLGRLHRHGQIADEVETYIYRHTRELRESWDRAKELALYVKQTIGSCQKLIDTTETWEDSPELSAILRWGSNR